MSDNLDFTRLAGRSRAEQRADLSLSRLDTTRLALLCCSTRDLDADGGCGRSACSLEYYLLAGAGCTSSAEVAPPEHLGQRDVEMTSIRTPRVWREASESMWTRGSGGGGGG